MTYRAGVIGLGRMGSTFDDEVSKGGSIFLPYCHAPSYHSSPHIELISGADPHDEQRSLFGKRWGLDDRHLYKDYQEMLEKENLDFVSICTTARVRAQITQNTAKSGVKAIWAEKPIAISLEEADAMVDVCKKENVVLAINCGRRWHPLFTEARKLIEEGELGKILQVTAYSQSNISHNGSHAIDTVRYLVGEEIEWVFGETEEENGDDDLMGNGYLAFANGLRGYLHCMPTGIADWEFDVIGEKGRIRFIANALDFELTYLDPGGQGTSAIPAKYPFPWPARMQGTGLTIIEDIVASIETGGKPRCSGEDGLVALEVALAIRESHRKGGVKVGLPLEDRTLRIFSSEIANDHIPARIRRSQRK